MPTTPNYSWPTPADTGYVKNGAQDMRNLGNAIDTTMATMVPKSTVTTNGDLIYGTGSGTLTRLGVGAEGTVLTVQGGVPVWSGAGTDNWTLISASGNLTSGAIYTFSTVSGYKKLRLVSIGVFAAGATYSIRLNADAGGNSYWWGGSATGSPTQDAMRLQSSTGQLGFCIDFRTADQNTPQIGEGASSGLGQIRVGRYTAGAITSVSLITSAAAFTGGNVALYGSN